MPLNFPTTASIGQIYSSGSSAQYQWNGSYWRLGTPPQASVLTATSASALGGTTPVILRASNVSIQTIPNETSTLVTNWGTSLNNTAGQWDATTGLFTAAYSSTYLVSAQLNWFGLTPQEVGRTFSVSILQISPLISVFGSAEYLSVSTAFRTNTSTGYATTIVNVNAGDTIGVRAFHNNGSPVDLAGTLNQFNMVEISNKIQRQ
jgi:hypothetical protein